MDKTTLEKLHYYELKEIVKVTALDPEELSIMENFLRGCRELKLFMKDK